MVVELLKKKNLVNVILNEYKWIIILIWFEVFYKIDFELK